MIRVTREELISDIAYAIGRNRRLLPGKGDRFAIEKSRAIAEAIVLHLEISKREVYRPDPKPWHSTPRS